MEKENTEALRHKQQQQQQQQYSIQQVQDSDTAGSKEREEGGVEKKR